MHSASEQSGSFLTTIFQGNRPIAVFLKCLHQVPLKRVDRGGTVVKVLCYTSEGRWFDPSWCHWHKILPIALWPWGRLSFWQKWVPAAFPGGKGGRCIRLTTLPPSLAVIMKSGNLNFLETSGPLQDCNGTDLPFTFKTLYNQFINNISV